MSPSVTVGLCLAVGTALLSVLGFLYKHRGAAASPPVEPRRPVRTSFALFRSGWYLIGLAVAMGSWGLHVGALALAPISLVQSVIAGGLVLLTVVADRMFGFAVTGREWIGVALTAAGLAFLAATLEGGADSAHSAASTGPLAAVVGAAAALGLLIAVASRSVRRGGPLLGAAAGLIWAASDVSIKALSDHLGDGAGAVLLSPLAPIILVASLVGLGVSARSLQIGPAVPVIAVTSAAANLVTIASGPAVFGEPLPDDARGLVLRVLAFGLVISAAALTPPPRPAIPGRRGP
jgi:drug/metabolite transporter (DMT)-like permease